MLRAPWILIVAGVLAAAVFPLDVTRSVLATAAATLFESLPFLVAGRICRIPAFLGCGCGEGPAARSMPALFATWLAFGPFIAVSRCIAAMAVGQFLRSPHTHDRGNTESLLSDLVAIAPYGVVAGIVGHIFPLLIALPHLSPVIAVVLGSTIGFLLAPCGIGAVGVATSLHAYLPAAAIGFWCVAGICDLRTFVRIPKPDIGNDRLAYSILAAACAFVAWQHGAALVHPKFAWALWACTIMCIWFAWRSKNTRSGIAAITPGLMFAIAILGAPMPTYSATATTLENIFPGEHFTFTGVLTRSHMSTAVTRYAITCCRADATPITVQLARDILVSNGRWVTVTGILERRGGELRLSVARFATEVSPKDPFIYR